ncbi:hypothetical protein BKA65DRAFT_489213 [Rhexocercosporidium sp. MPI-PUGE-AT-0058]|nr:hypothetical protein BKA65DRAFT_489213 [Rhexocercosporidium sp. MPI-PUGE-AT-0058]
MDHSMSEHNNAEEEHGQDQASSNQPPQALPSAQVSVLISPTQREFDAAQALLQLSQRPWVFGQDGLGEHIPDGDTPPSPADFRPRTRAPPGPGLLWRPPAPMPHAAMRHLGPIQQQQQRPSRGPARPVQRPVGWIRLIPSDGRTQQVVFPQLPPRQIPAAYQSPYSGVPSQGGMQSRPAPQRHQNPFSSAPTQEGIQSRQPPQRHPNSYSSGPAPAVYQNPYAAASAPPVLRPQQPTYQSPSSSSTAPQAPRTLVVPPRTGRTPLPTSPLRCPVCGARFTTIAERTHHLTHTSCCHLRRWNCLYCPQSFVGSQEKMTEHIKEKHATFKRS